MRLPNISQTHFLTLLITTVSILLPSSSSAAPAQTNLQPFAIEGAGAEQHLTTIDLVGLQRCMFGDLDALLLELKTANGSLGLQLSVESVGLDAREIYYGTALEKRTSEEYFGSYQLTLPRTSTPKVYGVFLCSIDEQNAEQAPCSAQMLKNAEDLFAPYRADTSNAASDQPLRKVTPYASPKELKPTIFYAQFFLRNSAGAAILADSNSPALLKTLTTFGIARKEAEKSVTQIKRFSDALNSLPLAAVEKHLQIQMPYYSETKCLGE